MRIIIFTVCQSAVARDGLLNITGAFSNLGVPRLPIRVSFTLATRLFFSSDEEGRFSGRLSFNSPDGAKLLDSPIELDVPIFENDGTGIYIDSVGAVHATLTTPGEHQFHFHAPGVDAIIFPFYIALNSPRS